MKKSLFILLSFSVILMIFSACTQQAVDVKAEIEAANVKFMEAANTGDAEALKEIYLPDATVYPPNADAVAGIDNIIPMMTASAPAGIKMVFETVSAMAYGAIAIEDGRYKVLAPDETVLDHGKYIVTWKKKGDIWKVSKDIWNTSNPPVPRAMAGDTVLFALTKMKEKDAHLIEEFSLDIFLPVYKELFPQDKAVTRIFKTPVADKDGYITYVYLADPFSSTQVHNVFTVLQAKYGREKTMEMMQKYLDIFKDQTPYATIQLEW